MSSSACVGPATALTGLWPHWPCLSRAVLSLQFAVAHDTWPAFHGHAASMVSSIRFHFQAMVLAGKVSGSCTKKGAWDWHLPSGSKRSCSRPMPCSVTLDPSHLGLAHQSPQHSLHEAAPALLPALFSPQPTQTIRQDLPPLVSISVPCCHHHLSNPPVPVSAVCQLIIPS